MHVFINNYGPDVNFEIGSISVTYIDIVNFSNLISFKELIKGFYNSKGIYTTIDNIVVYANIPDYVIIDNDDTFNTLKSGSSNNQISCYLLQ